MYLPRLGLLTLALSDGAAMVRPTRRAVLQRIVPGVLAAASPAWPVLAFENRLPPDDVELKYKSPRSPGPKPTDLGPNKETGGLKACIDGKPHCFSSTPEYIEDNDLFNSDAGTTTDWLVRPFKYDKTMEAALADLKAAIASYPPGQVSLFGSRRAFSAQLSPCCECAQNGIDGGGFKLITESSQTPGTAYLYVQFESLRRGYIDDMEFSLKDGLVQVRTSSRLGYLDLGVNAKVSCLLVGRIEGRDSRTQILAHPRAHHPQSAHCRCSVRPAAAFQLVRQSIGRADRLDDGAHPIQGTRRVLHPQPHDRSVSDGLREPEEDVRFRKPLSMGERRS